MVNNKIATDQRQALILTFWYRMKKVGLVILAIAAFLFLLPWLGMQCEPLSRVSVTTQEINVKTGELRSRSYLFGHMISETVSETSVSAAIIEPVEVADVPDWHLVNTRALTLNPSPHHRFHAALFQTCELDDLFAEKGYSPSQRKEVAEAILRSWQTTGSDYDAGRYIVHLQKKIQVDSSQVLHHRTSDVRDGP